jgi:uncharacterized protein YmfQ (DUF2313 family)
LKFFEAIKLLFPRSRAFELFVDSVKRKIVRAFSVLPEDIRHNAELVYMDLFPDTTRFLEKWEQVFAVYFPAREIARRRNILDLLWKINAGGQSLDYLEQILRGIVDVRVIDNTPVTDPRGIKVVRIAVCNYRSMVCGNRAAVCNARLGTEQSEPTVLRNDASELYTLPEDEKYWKMCFFICKDVMRSENKIQYIERIKLNIKWKNFIEYIILKIKPVHTTAILYIEWQEEDFNDVQG